MKKSRLFLQLLPIVSLLIIISCSSPKEPDRDLFVTYYEKNDFNRTPSYAETVDYCQLLAEHSSIIHYTSIGRTPQGRDIPLLIVDKDGLKTPEQIRAKGRVIVLAEACIHAGEPDGKDAGLMFIRDVALFNQHEGILDNVSFLFLPIINPDGHEDFGEHYRINQNGPVEVGARFTAQRYNMNRDFIKADAPEMRAFLQLYAQWLPEIFVDIHVTNGADFQYVSTYGLEHCEYLAPNMLDFSMNVFEKELQTRMASDGFPIFPYYFQETEVEGFGKSVLVDAFAPQYSNGYASANNRIGLLVENHIYKPYKDRVDCTYLYLKHTLEIAGQHHQALSAEVVKADAYIASDAFRKDSLALSYETDMTWAEPVEFLAWKDTTVISDLTGAPWRYYDYNAPITLHYSLFTRCRADIRIKLPAAYIIPQEQTETIELLDVHGITYSRLEKDENIPVETYHFTESEWSRSPYEGRVTLNASYEVREETIAYRRGDVIVPSGQPRIKIAAHLLEPKSPTSLVYWGFYNNFIKAPNEFWISLNYMEVKGREMLAKDPVLRANFERRMKEDVSFASDPMAIKQYFMAKLRETVEVGVNRYPVGRKM